MKLLIVALFLQGLVQTMGQAQAPAPGPAGPTNVTAILSKAGQFTMFVKLLESTQEADQINNQLNNSNSGLTIFAPPDNAFSSLKSGLLNSLSDQQKVQLVQFHILSDYVAQSEFQTASNPLRTQAGNSNDGEYPLNVTTSGNQVNITTGVVNTTVSNSIYSDGQLAVYQVDQVLLPLAFFRTPAPAPAPEGGKPKKGAKAADTSDDNTDDSTDTSGASELVKFRLSKVVFAISLAAASIYMVL
ncbi:fasciclin-like arabinogalactan protein 11 [Chenopodium quinoa]|uniref:fasciclin-like arabinogalactan protein 11 n=1 Tax=Chenopodium quinoa TaxID=63459 RepID=UPI000B770770|nr:fasciclin-like arabinogalactan protein 11 [Chenopodium quinoa]